MTYISGPMTGLPDFNRQAFLDAEKKLTKNGFVCFNPARVFLDDDATWEDYMREDIKALLECQSVFMLPGWEGSRGALLEHAIAESLGLIIFDRIAE